MNMCFVYIVYNIQFQIPGIAGFWALRTCWRSLSMMLNIKELPCNKKTCLQGYSFVQILNRKGKEHAPLYVHWSR
jgi:hypothetical protein